MFDNQRERARRYIEQRSIPVPEAGCWMWLPSLYSSGYGQAVFEGKHWVASRLSHEAYNGIIPVGLFVQHSCDSPWCVAPSHLSVGTDVSNMIDKQRKGRAARKLTADQVQAIFDDQDEHKRIAARYGVTRSMVAKIKQGSNWTHVVPEKVALPTPAARSRSRRTTKLTIEKAREIRARVAAGERRADLAVEYGVCPATIAHIMTGHQWKEAA